MMDNIEIYDSDDGEDFVEEDWVGKGRRLPGTVPPGLDRYLRRILSIPPEIQDEHLPDAQLNVQDFLARQLLHQDVSLVTFKAELIFSKDAPNLSASCLRQRSLPTRSFIVDAAAAAGQAILDDAHSITDPRYKGGRIPIWTITFWQAMQEVIDTQETWRRASAWLQHKDGANGPTGHALQEVREVLRHLAWSAPVTVLGAHTSVTTRHFAGLLSSQMVSMTMVDMMISWVAETVRANILRAGQFEVVGLALASKLLGLYNHRVLAEDSPRWIQRLEAILRRGKKKILFPIFLEEKQHFVVVCIDSVERTLSYGDSLQHQGFKLPVKIKRMIEQWVSAKVGTYQWHGCSLPSGTQRDGVSCGMCSVNIVTHLTLSEDLWTPEDATFERLRWFIRIATAHSNESDPPTTPPAEPQNAAPGAASGIPHGMEGLLLETHGSAAIEGVDDMPMDRGDSPEPPHWDQDATDELLALSAPENTNEEMRTMSPIDYPQYLQDYDSEGLQTDAPCPSDTDMSTGAEDWRLEERDDEEMDGPRVGSQDGVIDLSSDSSEDTRSVHVEMEGGRSESSSRQSNRDVWPIFKRQVKPSARQEIEGEQDMKTRKRSSSAVSTLTLSTEDTKRPKPSHTHVHKRPHAAPLPAGIKLSDDGRPARVGNSRSSTRTRIEKEAIQHGTFVLEKDKYEKFQQRILREDMHASFDPDDSLRVRHSTCGSWLIMRQNYNTTAFIRHIHGYGTRRPCNSGPKTTLSGAGTNTLGSFWHGGAATSKTKQAPKMVERPCPGLRAADWTQIDVYLQRTFASGGGGTSLPRLTAKLYPNTPKYSSLSPREKEVVRNTQESEFKWLNKRLPDRVVSTACVGTLSVRDSIDEKDVPPCISCKDLFKKKNFKVALRVPIPSDKNSKYVPKMWRVGDNYAVERFGRVSGLRDIIEASKNNTQEPCIVFAQWVLAGHFEAEHIFVSLVRAMVDKKERELHGIGMEGFRYPPDVTELSHIIAIHSVRAYQAIRNVLPVPTERTLERHRARELRFPIGIQEETFDLAVDYVENLDYSGPLGLSCDDTKLLPSLDPYYDAKRKGHYIIGSTGEPMRILDPEGLRRVLEQGKIDMAEKVRLYCLQSPMPGVPTLVLCAIAIPGNLSADILEGYLDRILFGLLQRGLGIVGYAADGAATERKVQRQIIAKASGFRDYIIHHPGRTRNQDINLRIPLFGDQHQPIAMIQDSNHGRKTYRNNAFSARIMTLGDHPILYSHFRAIAFEGGPIYPRDVEKLDRQDDNAVTRLFSGHTLRWLTDNHSEWLGTIVYLFIFGELIDAYQSRSMSISDRVYLALRALFFMEMWEDFLNKMEYPKSQHFLSHEAVDITHTLIFGLLQLVIIYRDDYKGEYPLLPWLLGTETCEHVFGICRQIVKDFTMLDFQYMIPKLHVRLREQFFFNHTSDGKSRASGYNHTYTDSRGISLVALSTFPSDNDIQSMSYAAYEESRGLWDLLGVKRPNLTSNVSQRFPPISSWFSLSPGTDYAPLNNRRRQEFAGDADVNADADSDVDDDEGEEDIEDETLGAKVQRMMNILEKETASDSREEEQWNGLAYAAAAVTIQKTMSILELPDDDGNWEAERERIGDVLANCLPAVDDPNERVDLTGDAQLPSLNLDALVDLRLHHHTKHADTGVRQKVGEIGSRAQANRRTSDEGVDEQDAALDEGAGTGKDAETPVNEEALDDGPSLALYHHYSKILKDRAVKGIGTGAERGLRWRTAAPGGRGGVSVSPMPPTAGATANAAAVATSAAKKLQVKRSAVIQKHKLPAFVAKANIDMRQPVCAATDSSIGGSGYGLILRQNGIGLAKVLSISSKTAGKGVLNAWVTDSSSITAVSYMAVQVFKHTFGRQFTAIFDALGGPIANRRFARIKPAEFLFMLNGAPHAMGPTSLLVSASDGEALAALRKVDIKAIVAAVKDLNSRASKQVEEAQVSDDE